MPAYDAAIDLSDILLPSDIRCLIGDEPSQPRQMVRFAACFGEYGNDIFQRPFDLDHKVVADEGRVFRPADLPGDEDMPPLSDHSIGIAFGRLPAFRMKKFEIAHVSRSNVGAGGSAESYRSPFSAKRRR